MIDLTPLDVRKKRGDFRRAMRGYDPEEVDIFLEVVADRLEELVKENMTLRERASSLGTRLETQEGRERAVQDALVTAQQLREEIRGQAQKEADFIRREAEARIERAVDAARAKMVEFKGALQDLERQRARFLKGFRSALERELDSVEIEEQRTPLDDFTLEIDLSGGTRSLSSLLDEAGTAVEGDDEEGTAAEEAGAPEIAAAEAGGARAQAPQDDVSLAFGVGGSESGSVAVTGAAAESADSAAADAEGAPSSETDTEEDDDFVDIFGEKARVKKDEP
jgi:cell division initiation protein